MNTALIRPSLAELTRTSLKIGCLGFGGPAGQIALMHRIFVDEKKWMDEPRYLNALNYCMLLPGPEAQQLATYIGWLLHGVRGGIIAGALFVVPGALIVLGLSWLYAAHGQAPLVVAAFFGIKAAVLALVAEALIKIGRRALKGRLELAIAVAAFLAIYLFGVPFPLVVMAAALLGLARAANTGDAETVAEQSQPQPSARGAFSAAAFWGLVWLTPPALALALLGPNHILTQVGGLFSQLAVTTFGGAYAVLTYLQQQAVETHGWLSSGQMMDGLGLAENTPGPLILVGQFVGYLAGWQAKGGGLLLAMSTAAMASWCIFAPSFLWIFAGAPFAEQLRTNRAAAGALAAISAAVIGVIANLAIQFGSHILFPRELGSISLLGRSLRLPDLASIDLVATAIAVTAAAALIRYKVNVILVVLACALAGMGLSILR